MAERVIPLIDHRRATQRQPLSTGAASPHAQWLDLCQRHLRDLRISVTDRCNFRCSYCMPKEIFDAGHTYLRHSDLLSFEEITRLACLFVAHGVRKIRLTGGEPLLRKNIEELVASLATLRTVDGHPVELTLTTNGSLLARKARALAQAGLRRVTVSLDALDDAVFRRMNNVDFPVSAVLHGIEEALNQGLAPVKVNMVVKRGTNDHEIVTMARHFRGSGVVLRFIEYMDVGVTNGWCMDEVLPGAQVIDMLRKHWAMVPLTSSTSGETAERWGYADASGRHHASYGEVGVINSVTQAFCGDCNRARLSTDGRLYTCLFASTGHDLRSLLRGHPEQHPSTDGKLAKTIGQIWQHRGDRYSELRTTLDHAHRERRGRVEMSYIGG